MPARVRSEGIVLLPALATVALLVWWAAHDGGYAATTWEPSALAVLGLLVAVVAGIGPRRVRLSRPAAIALAALAAYVAWSYLSILWAAAPGDALDGSNRALLFLLLFALFAVLPWRMWTALGALAAFALGIGALALATLVRIGLADQVGSLFSHGRLVWPLGYENASAALFLTGGIVSVALAARRELPPALRVPLLALATAALQASVLCESRGWLFALPVVLALALAIMPARLRFALWALPPVAGTLLALPALLHVFERFDRVDRTESLLAAQRALTAPAAHASAVALPICAAMLVLGLALVLADRRVAIAPRVARGATRAAAALAIVAALVGAAAGLAATHGRPDRTIARYWNRSNGYRSAAAGSSRFLRLGSNRPDFWRVALDAAAAHPLQGLGQDNWSDYYLSRRRSRDQPRWTHSVELRLLAHTGIVGLLLFGTFLIAACVAALRGRRRARQLASAAAATALLPLIVWFVHGSIDWFWEFPALSGPAFAFAGLATGLMRDPAAPAVAPLRPRAAAIGAAAATLVTALALAFPYLAEREMARATGTWRLDPAGALGSLSRARDLNPLSAQPDLLAGVIALELGRPADARAHLNAAMRRTSGDWFLPFIRGLAESEAGERERARASFLDAHGLDPRDPLPAQALSRVDGRHPLTAAEAFASVRREVKQLTGKS